MTKPFEISVTIPEGLDLTLNYAKIMRKATAPIVKAVKARIRKGVDIDGKPLPEAKDLGAHKRMRRTDQLLNSITATKLKRKKPKKTSITAKEGYRTDANRRPHKVVLFSLVQGSTGGRKGKRKIPPRKVIGVTAAEEKLVQQAAQNEIDRQIKANEAKLRGETVKKVRKK